MEIDNPDNGKLSPDSGIAEQEIFLDSMHSVNNITIISPEAEKDSTEMFDGKKHELQKFQRHSKVLTNNTEEMVEEMPIKEKEENTLEVVNISADENLNNTTLTSIKTLLPSMNKRSINRIEELNHNQSSTKPIVIIAKKSRCFKQDIVKISGKTEFIKLGSFPSEAFFVENTIQKKSVKGRNQRKKIEFISREKPVISVFNDNYKSEEKNQHKSKKSTEVKKTELNKINCKVYRMKKKYEDNELYEEHDRLLAINKELKIKMATLKEELDSLVSFYMGAIKDGNIKVQDGLTLQFINN